MMRRIPVYILVDLSDSMQGEPMQCVENGLQMLISSLTREPRALETVHISVITFSNTPPSIVPLTTISNFHAPQLARGHTALGEALEFLAQRVDAEVQKNTYEKKGDWHPWAFIFSNGIDTGDISKGVAEIKKRRFDVIVNCVSGSNADIPLLKQITDYVIQLETAESGSFREYFPWLWSSPTIIASSKPTDTFGQQGSDTDELPPPPPELNIMI